MSSWRRIDDGGFPHLAVQRQEGRRIYSITFSHREIVKRRWAIWLLLASSALVFASVYAIGLAPDDPPAWLGILPPLGLLMFIVVIILATEAMTAPKLGREIQVDYEQGTFSVLRNHKLEWTRKLSGGALPTMTVDPHPEAEAHRQHRMENNRKQMTLEERSHVLTGWFGPRGAERVIIVSRFEWPCQFSLQEVQQAVMWTGEQDAAERGRRRTAEEPSPGRPKRGIKPPLD